VHGRHVEFSALALPRIDQVVHLIAHVVKRNVESLDVENLSIRKNSHNIKNLDIERHGGHDAAVPGPTWSPATYLRFVDERTRPFAELVSRIGAQADMIVDLGCGPGHLTPVLRARWPKARIVGIDSSPQMVATAREEHSGPGVEYVEADLRVWHPPVAPDLLISNATFQWVPDHLGLLPELADRVTVGGTFAFSVPANFTEPSHVLLRQMAAEEPYRRWCEQLDWPASHDAVTYLDLLSRPGWVVDAWETTYLHVLQGQDPVFAWISGTGARPALQALPALQRADFEAAYKQRLRQAYPPRPYGTVLPFRRVFVIARREEVTT
jgi:trans-aconitate 2-methyltransferase